MFGDTTWKREFLRWMMEPEHDPDTCGECDKWVREAKIGEEEVFNG